MEKKTYIKPEMEVAELSVESPMLTGSPSEPDWELNDKFVNTEDEGGQLSIGRGNRRGKWGNLWYTE